MLNPLGVHLEVDTVHNRTLPAAGAGTRPQTVYNSVQIEAEHR